MSLSHILGRLDAARQVLHHVEGSANYQRHVMWQTRAIEDALQETYSNEDYSILCEKIADVGFPPEDEERLINKITPTAMIDDGSKLQNYTAVVKYIDQERWSALQKCKHNDIMLFMKMTDFFIALGLNNPSCPTYGVIAALFQWIKQGSDGIMSILREEKKGTVLQMKKLFKERIENQKARAEGAIRLKTLPEDPNLFFRLYPAYKKIMPIDLERIIPDAHYIRTYAVTFPLRSRRSKEDVCGAMPHGSSSALEGVLRTLLQSQASMLEKYMHRNDGCELKILGRGKQRPAIENGLLALQSGPTTTPRTDEATDDEDCVITPTKPRTTPDKAIVVADAPHEKEELTPEGKASRATYSWL